MGSLSVYVFQFMKFMKRLGDGELTIRDNQVVEVVDHSTKSADTWAGEFSNERRANQWVGEYTESASGRVAGNQVHSPFTVISLKPGVLKGYFVLAQNCICTNGICTN